MHRTGLLVALVIAAVVGFVFAIRPDLDLKLAELFFDPERGGFWRGGHRPYMYARDAARWLVALIALPAVVALVLKLVRPRWPFPVPVRAAALMLITLALAPWVVANLVFKDNWSRPRPIGVTEFGGAEHFRPWWDPRGDCPKNCSFVAGEPSAAFWTLAPAVLLPPPWRAIATAGAVAFGAAVGLLRMAAGAHFFTDVVFAGVFAFLVIWLLHGLLYRWPRPRWIGTASWPGLTQPFPSSPGSAAVDARRKAGHDDASG